MDDIAVDDIEVRVVVRDRRWGGRYTGTVVRTETASVFVAWHGSWIEDELRRDEVEVWPDSPPELAAWRGGGALLASDATVTVDPVVGEA